MELRHEQAVARRRIGSKEGVAKKIKKIGGDGRSSRARRDHDIEVAKKKSESLVGINPARSGQIRPGEEWWWVQGGGWIAKKSPRGADNPGHLRTSK